MSTTIYPPPGSIKSIQRGTTTSNVTVAAVNMNKAVLHHNGEASGSNSAANASLLLTSSINIAYSAGSLSTSPSVSWELVEYY